MFGNKKVPCDRSQLRLESLNIYFDFSVLIPLKAIKFGWHGLIALHVRIPNGTVQIMTMLYFPLFCQNPSNDGTPLHIEVGGICKSRNYNC